MIENNKFFIDKLNTVVFLGASQNFKELIKFNDSINIKSLIITSPHQFKIIPKDPSIKINIIESLDASFK